MTGIAGVASLTGNHSPTSIYSRFQAITVEQAAFGRSAPKLLECADAVAALIASKPYPDTFATQCDAHSFRIAQAASIRIAGLELGAGDDAALVLRAFERWGVNCFSRIEGDFLFLQWNSLRAELICARAPLTEIGLFLSFQNGLVEWASLAPALGRGRDPDFAALAEQYSGHSIFGLRGTGFRGVWAPPPGVATIVDQVGIREHRFWDPATEHVTRRDDEEAAAALREALSEAVGDALASTGTIVASHLSAGRDSSAVTAFAARGLEERQGRLHAYTAVPGPSYGGVPGRYLLDEGPDAARFAACFNAIAHHKVASTDVKLGALLDEWNSNSALGHSNAVGLIWWSRIFAQASAEGADTLLSGGLGNFTISAGGPWAIPDVLHAGNVTAWRRELRAATRHPDASVKNLLASSFLPLLPGKVGQALNRRRRARHGSQIASLPPFFRGELVEASQKLFEGGGWREPLLYRDLLFDCLRTADLADPRPWLHHGVVLRDPTADRRVVRAALSLTAEQLASPYDRRPIFEQAFRGIIPDQTLRQPRRGHQGADWNKAIDVSELRDAVARYGRNPVVRSQIDIPELQRALALWPGGICVDGPLYMLLVVRALPAIALASFLNFHF